jgi:hypothetical protein
MATNPALTQQASHGRDDPVVTALVTRARNGDRQAWDALVDQYTPLIWSICRRYRLQADAHDAAPTVWLQLVDHLDRLRDPDTHLGISVPRCVISVDKAVRSLPGRVRLARASPPRRAATSGG